MTFPGRWWHQPTPQDAFWLSWVSLACTIVAAIGGIIGFTKTESTLILTFGLENVVDFISSVVVLWRFYCPHGYDEEKLAKLQKREERASLAISMVIGLLGIFVFAIGVLDMTESDKDTDLSLLFQISFVSIIVFGILTVVKFKYANDLDSPSLYKDGICSLIGTSLSASLLLTTAIIDYAPGAWYIDPVVSLIIGVSSIVYGFRVVFNTIRSGVPIFESDWWLSCGAQEEVENDKELTEVEKSDIGDYDGGKPAEARNYEHEVI